MSKKIEKLLRIVSEMQTLDKDISIEKSQVIPFFSDELTISDLDMVSAASQEPTLPECLKNDTL